MVLERYTLWAKDLWEVTCNSSSDGNGSVASNKHSGAHTGQNGAISRSRDFAERSLPPEAAEERLEGRKRDRCDESEHCEWDGYHDFTISQALQRSGTYTSFLGGTGVSVMTWRS